MLVYLLVSHLFRFLLTVDWRGARQRLRAVFASADGMAPQALPALPPSKVVRLPRAVVSSAGSQQWIEIRPGDLMALRIHSRDVNGAFTIVEARVLPYSGPPLHVHHERDEIFEVLDGLFRFQCGDDVFDLAPGMTIVVPRGMPHAWVNLGPRQARLLFSFVPGGIDELFEKMTDTPLDQLAALAALHDTHVVGPRLVVDGAAEPWRDRRLANVAFLAPRS
ncbi:MAG: cupin domain-containing protein [Tardiphaga sp.]